MLRKVIVLLLMVAVLWVSGCATGTSVANDPSALYGPCAKMMPYYYCSTGP